LVSRLDRHKAHRRALNRLANRFRIGGIVLVALDVRLHVLRRHQSNLVAKRAQLPRPVVRRRARLQANQTCRQPTEEPQNLRTPKLLAQTRPSLCINPVHLKNMLRQVQSDRSNLAHGWLPFAADSIRQQFGTQMPQGGHPPHQKQTTDLTSRGRGSPLYPQKRTSFRPFPPPAFRECRHRGTRLAADARFGADFDPTATSARVSQLLWSLPRRKLEPIRSPV